MRLPFVLLLVSLAAAAVVLASDLPVLYKVLVTAVALGFGALLLSVRVRQRR